MVLPAGFFVFLAAVMYIGHSVSVKFSSGKIDVYSGIFFWSLGAVFVGVSSFIYGKFFAETTSISWSGGVLLAVAGALISIGSLSFLLAYERNVDYSFAAPLVNISVVTGGLIFGLLLFKEDISMARVAGVVLGCISIFLLTRS